MATTIKTFAELEKQVLSEGYKAAVLNRFISRFDSESGYAVIYYLGAGKGFALETYTKEK